MGTFKMIVYPFGLALVGLLIAVLLGMVAFGVESADWADWQNELVGTVGTVAGFSGAMFGLWLAIRSERRVVR